jgi:hypothetical protein
MDASLRGLSVFSSKVFRSTTSGRVSFGPTFVLAERSRSILGFGMIAPESFDTRTFLPSSKNFHPTLVGFLMSIDMILFLDRQEQQRKHVLAKEHNSNFVSELKDLVAPFPEHLSLRVSWSTVHHQSQRHLSKLWDIYEK